MCVCVWFYWLSFYSCLFSADAAAAGANVIVAGTSIFGAADARATIASFRATVDAALALASQ